MLGILMAIVKFEYRYVEKLNCGTKPEHKKYIIKLKRDKCKQHIMQIVGCLMMMFPIVVLMTDTWCIKSDIIITYQDSKLNYCWNS